jgi:O-antigen biosynthesis protein
MIKVDAAQAALEQAQTYWQAKEWQLTIQACAKALALDQKLAQAHKLMGDALQKTGKVDEAIGYYQQAIALQPNFAKVYANLGSLYAHQKQWQQALDSYQQALRIDPELLGVHQNLATILKLQQQGETLAESKLPKLTLEDYLHQGKIFKHQGKLQEALQQYRQAAELAPQEVKIYREIVNISERLGLWQDAAKYCRLILQLSNPNQVVGVEQTLRLNSVVQPQLAKSKPPEHRQLPATDYLELAQNSIKEKKYESAITYYHRAIEKQPDLAEAYLGWAELLTKSGAREQAIACYLQGLKQVEDNPEIYYRLGNLYQQESKWSQAAVCYQKAVQYAVDHAQAHHELAEVLSHLEQWSEAIISYRQAIKYNPDFSWSYNNLGYALIQMSQWQEAIPVYQKAIELNRDFSWSYYNLAEAYSKTNQWSQAADLYQKAAAIQPDLPQLSQKIGHALYHRGHQDLDEALQHFKLAIEQEPQELLVYHQAIAIDKTNLELYLKLGDLLIQQGQLDEGIVTYQMALQVHPQNSEVTARLKEALQKKTLTAT